MEQHFTESGFTHAEVLSKIRTKYGDSAKILFYKSIRLGGFLGLFSKEGIEYTGYISTETKVKRRESDEKSRQEILSLAKNKKEEKSSIDQVLQEMKVINEKLSQESQGKGEQLHPSLQKIKELLEDNDFSQSYISQMIDRLKREFSLDDLDKQTFLEESLAFWIGESLVPYEKKYFPSPRIFVLVGPTGVGKTTTIAKLAAIHGITSTTNALSVCMITIDNYRIGAKTQIETYGDIMGIPVFTAESYEDLKTKIDNNRDHDLVLVDTIGKSPRDFMKLAEMRAITDACGPGSDVHLGISSTTKSKDIIEIMEQFEPFHYNSVILTKLDETTRVGNLISILSEKKKPLSYVTDGQGVPQDITDRGNDKLLKALVGFNCDMDKVIERLKKKYRNTWSS